MTPSWYDVLDVAPDATADEIRAAWKAAIANLDPGDRRFRTLNEAAEVLLDQKKRAEYDASLEPEPEEQSQSAQTEAQPQAGSAADEVQDSRTTSGLKVPAWLLAALAVVVALLLAAAGYLVTQPSDDDIASATRDAQVAAEQAAHTILAYDWQTMDQDEAAADALLTSSYRKKYDELFAVLKENQPQTKTVVRVDKIVASGVVRSGDDRVQILVFVNRSRTNAASAEPVAYRDSVVMTMEHDSGDWLVDCMDTNPLGDQEPTKDPC